jgi:poly-gamma-glutamate synthesis protein (capsule biosynthesis protein)
VIDAGADLVFGHGAHLNQGVELYDGRPILHCIGQFAFDWPKTRHKRDGLVARVHVTDGDIARLALVPVYRDGNNDVYLAGPDTSEGSRQLRAVADLSPDPVPFDVEGPEAVFDLPE